MGISRVKEDEGISSSKEYKGINRVKEDKEVSSAKEYEGG